MTVSNISPVRHGALATASNGFYLAGRDDFTDKLQLGQIIKGRVLRHYEGGRYAVDFGGREKVVDSAVPLRTGDVMHGKVVGLGDRVELERVRELEQSPAQAHEIAPESGSWIEADDASRLVARLFEQYRARLNAQQVPLIEKAVRGAEDRDLMAMSALLLAKLGVGIPADLLKAIYELLRTDPKRGVFSTTGKALELKTADVPREATQDLESESAVPGLAKFLKQSLDKPPEHSARDRLSSAPSGHPSHSTADAGGEGNPESDPQGGYDLGRWLLNVQTGGSVAHHTNTVPLLINGRLVELNIAVFEQRGGTPAADIAKHRQLSFSLHSEQLGQVEAHVMMTGERVKMRICSDRDTTSDWLATYSADLVDQLKADGWSVDELNYQTKPAEPAVVARAVLQHLISQDSLSRLV